MERNSYRNMSSKERKKTRKTDAGRLSLMYTLHAISRLSKDEFELLKKLRRRNDLKETIGDGDAEILQKVQKILDDFHVKSIQEVIDIVENFKLFELYRF